MACRRGSLTARVNISLARRHPLPGFFFGGSLTWALRQMNGSCAGGSTRWLVLAPFWYQWPVLRARVAPFERCPALHAMELWRTIVT